MKEFFLETPSGKINILEGIDILNIKAIILHLHGLSCHFQHIYRSCDDLDYKDEFFSKYNYKSIGFEYRGHGKSDGRQHTIYDFNDLITDLENVIKLINFKYPNKKIFLVGESMSGAVVLKYIALRTHNISGIVLLSPMCGIEKSIRPSYIMQSIMFFVSKILPHINYTLSTSIADSSILNKKYIIAYANHPFTKLTGIHYVHCANCMIIVY